VGKAWVRVPAFQGGGEGATSYLIEGGNLPFLFGEKEQQRVRNPIDPPSTERGRMYGRDSPARLFPQEKKRFLRGGREGPQNQKIKRGKTSFRRSLNSLF